MRVDLALVPGRGDDVAVEQAHYDVAENNCAGHDLGRLYRCHTGPGSVQSGRDVVDEPRYRNAQARKFDEPGPEHQLGQPVAYLSEIRGHTHHARSGRGTGGLILP